MGIKKLTFATAPRELFRFEERHCTALKELDVDGWNLWQICKVGIFYHLISEKGTSGVGRRRQPKFKLLLELGINTWKFFWYRLSRNKVLFLTHSADKLSKDKDGIYYNSIIYPIFDLNIFKKKLIIETPTATGFLKPSKYEWHIDRRVLNLFSRIAYKIKGGIKISYHQKSQELADLLNGYLREEGYTDVLATAFVEQVIRRFLVEKHYFRRLLIKLKTVAVVGSEAMGTGVLAAANELGIPFIELQHGAIDRYYPSYVWDPRFLDLDKIIKPSKILAFGSFAQKIITSTGFFKHEEVKPVGYYKMQQTRVKFLDNSGMLLLKKILVVVQPMMHELNIVLIETLLTLKTNNFEIHFKAHPLQSEQELEQYTKMITGSGIHIVPKMENIYEQIMQSDLIIGYVSTSLEEALSLGKASITITTATMPEGIHSLTEMTVLKDAIRCCGLADLGGMIERFYKEEDYRTVWYKEIAEKKSFIYADNYTANIKSAMHEYKSKD